MLKTTRSSKELAPKVFRINNNEVVKGNNGRKANETVKNSSKVKKSKNMKSEILMYTNIRATEKPTFLTSGTRKAFNHLK